MYDSAMKEKELRSKFTSHVQNCNCDRGELFWISNAAKTTQKYDHDSFYVSFHVRF